jgi:hypothetical protein
MIHPMTLLELGRARQRDLQCEANAERLARQAKAARPVRPGEEKPLRLKRSIALQRERLVTS